MNRRNFFGQSAAVSISLAMTPLAFGVEQADPVFSGDIDYSDTGDSLPHDIPFGTNPALDEEEKLARQILDAAPTTGSLQDIEYYFMNLTVRNKDGELYNSQWKNRWNPVIVQFFRSTASTAHNDLVPWCAAFQNWCLDRLGFKGTNSASSGSFRTYGLQVTDPKPGDFVVFRDKDPDAARQGHGHIALFLYRDGDRVFVLGGNQHAGKHFTSVNVSHFPLVGYMPIDGYRRPVKK
ncbi:TIGR02594 family protein [Paraburkholderia phytofirmans]|nr:TIGR02594 family protein [Paraburkholderia phytofirmans]